MIYKGSNHHHKSIISPAHDADRAKNSHKFRIPYIIESYNTAWKIPIDET